MFSGTPCTWNPSSSSPSPSPRRRGSPPPSADGCGPGHGSPTQPACKICSESFFKAERERFVSFSPSNRSYRRQWTIFHKLRIIFTFNISPSLWKYIFIRTPLKGLPTLRIRFHRRLCQSFYPVLFLINVHRLYGNTICKRLEGSCKKKISLISLWSRILSAKPCSHWVIYPSTKFSCSLELTVYNYLNGTHIFLYLL